ncbi:MAG: type II secretion system ATPase GspE [Nitrospirota bacterium]
MESFESSLEPPKPKQPPFEHVFLNERPAERGIASPVETERIRKFQEEAQGPPDDNLKNNLKSQEIPPQESLRKQLPFKYLSLEERLIERGIISAEERERILKLKEEGQAPLLRLLVELGFVSEENLLVQVSDFLCVPLVSLSDFPSISLPLEPFSDAVDFLKHNRIVPLKMEGKDLIVATTDPTLLSPLHAIEVLTGLRVKPVLAREKDIAARIEELFGSSTSFKSEGGPSPDREIDETVNEGDLEHLRDMASEVPVIRIVNQMISRALETRASDIHIEPFEDEVKVRYRIDGVLHEVDPPPRHFSAAIISRFKILAQLDIAERRLPQDGRIKTKIAGKDLDMRIATIPTLYGESVVVRLLERSQIFADLESLGFSQDLLVRFNDMITKPHGMVLVTGPTGSGKTTTLYAALQRINDPGKKIITIEDPVEYQLRGVNQIQVKPKIGLTFANGLRSIVRQDPDIIMVGEIRDFETAEIAVQAALTGHLVLSTLHTNDAAGAISRLLEMGVQDYLLASSLIGILAQRLVRRLCLKCREEIPVESLKFEGFEGDIRKLTQEEWAEIFNGGKISTLWDARGCDSCSRTGYMGRVGIYELLSVTPEICQQIIQRADSGSIRNLAQTQGMRLLREDGWHKIRTGLTTLSEVLKVVRRED